MSHSLVSTAIMRISIAVAATAVVDGCREAPQKRTQANSKPTVHRPILRSAALGSREEIRKVSMQNNRTLTATMRVIITIITITYQLLNVATKATPRSKRYDRQISRDQIIVIV